MREKDSEKIKRRGGKEGRKEREVCGGFVDMGQFSD